MSRNDEDAEEVSEYLEKGSSARERRIAYDSPKGHSARKDFAFGSPWQIYSHLDAWRYVIEQANVSHISTELPQA